MKVLITSAVCFASIMSTQAKSEKMLIPNVKVNIVDVNGVKLTEKNSSLNAKLQVTQKKVVYFKAYPSHTISFKLGKQVVDKYLSNSIYHKDAKFRKNRTELNITQKSVNTSRGLDELAISFDLNRTASCPTVMDNTKENGYKYDYARITTSLRTTAIVNGVEEDCNELLNFKGSASQMQKKLNSLPSEITCKADISIERFDDDFKEKLKAQAYDSERCIGLGIPKRGGFGYRIR